MKGPAIAAVALLVIGTIGWINRSHPYRLDRAGQPTDQAALSHRDSAYASSTWVVSEAANVMELRFFDRVEGGVCLRPTWGELQVMAQNQPALSHLVSSEPVLPAPAHWMWPHGPQGKLPDPGTLPHTRYVCLYPAAILLNDRLATETTPRDARAEILVVGLGSGVGLAVYAHHFPHASITVVDIDQTVIDLVRDHYPFMRWLETQQTDDGRPRLRQVALDARQYILMHIKERKKPFDVILLDAYTSGSTIPPHLMTREFYAECAAAMSVDGILMSNIIGSYEPAKPSSTKHLVLGGAMRSMVAGGFTYVHNLPIPRSPQAPQPRELKNNMVMASKVPLSAQARGEAWERLRSFVPYPELERGQPRYISRTVSLFGDGALVAAAEPADALDLRVPGLRGRLTAQHNAIFGTRYISNDLSIISQVRKAITDAYAERGRQPPAGWAASTGSPILVYDEIDWVAHARQVWESTIRVARAHSSHDGQTLIGADQRSGIFRSPPLFTDARPNADIYNTGD